MLYETSINSIKDFATGSRESSAENNARISHQQRKDITIKPREEYLEVTTEMADELQPQKRNPKRTAGRERPRQVV